MAPELGITPDGVRYHLKKLREVGIIEHVDPNTGGSWRITSSRRGR